MNNNFVQISWFGKHFGEEPPLVGNKDQGSGAIFFTGCNLKCVFCQNYQISHKGLGKSFSIDELVSIMLDLQKQNCLNINFVTPTIWFEQIKSAILLAKEKGLKIPIVWNSNGYEVVEILKEMNGLVDIYLPDFKYGTDKTAEKYSKIFNYPKTAKNAVLEMLSHVGNLKTKNNIAKKGVIVRHLVLPNNLDNTFVALDLLSEIDKNIYISLMGQYNPIFKSKEFVEISRKLYLSEWEKAKNYLKKKGFENGWIQDLDSADCLVPDFNKKNPFEK